MAEFQEVCKQWRRMCKAQDDTNCGACESCPMMDNGASCIAVYEDDFDKVNFAHIEQTVTEWAAEHPEPVYETWFEYLLRIGVIPENAPAGGVYQWIVESIKHKHISNDIAESLKLHPKEAQA